MTAASPPLLSVVIPTLNESESIVPLLDRLATLAVAVEVIVADGGSKDATVELVAARGARVVHSPAGRGRQLRAGADAATAPLLCFLHADVRLGPAALAALERLALCSRDHADADPFPAFAFRLRIGSERRIYRLIEYAANLRSRRLRLPYGDQGLIVRADEYRGAGGYPEWPLMEDVALIRSLGRITRVTLLGEEIVVSPRRWERDGPLRRSASNLLILFRFALGASPASLAARYRAGGVDG